MEGVQYYELFRGIALKSNFFLFIELTEIYFMLFANSKFSVYVPITIKNTRLEKVYTTKFLGNIYSPELDMITSCILCANYIMKICWYIV